MTDTSPTVIAVGYGGPDVLRVIEIDPGDPGPGEVLLDIRAAAVNPIDWKLYAPSPHADPTRLPMRLGFEVAGVVAAVGPSVRWLSPGDEVIAWRVRGGYTGRLVVPEQVTVRKPASLDWAAASGLLLTGATAVHTLTATRTGTGDVVLVHGGSGGVGRMVVQLAALRGARVIATASPASHDDLRALGAEPVAYGTGLVERVREAAGAPVTVAIDTVGSDEALDSSVELVADRTRIATIAGFARAAGLGVLALGGGPGADPGTQVREAARAQLVELAADQALDVAVAGVYPLDQVALAHEVSRAGHARGKLVLTP
ncbi:NADP-dependent oxidoreductase [Cellulomonas composti]|uniref:Putative oxidoreductase n=1 Tax=Cellulomonas composti TaxID=266130 RepID=A0A511JD83_9CELL|nr:NADP-dependent oxidoreductase [Cellulomonas composti]GEL95749.1 putative oxidoreductase [Cellulomonas composti]